ncbi:MAG: hypothetical protein FJ278_05030 [Planctomycetes bacterium]|nr:hypothetical protein [Planctomycetota bacterium]
MKAKSVGHALTLTGLLGAWAAGGCLTLEPHAMVKKEQQARYCRAQAEVVDRHASDQKMVAKGLREESAALMAKRDECARMAASMKNMGAPEALVSARYYADQARRFEGQAKELEQTARRIEREVADGERQANKLRKQASNLDAEVAEAVDMAQKIERLRRDKPKPPDVPHTDR